MNKILCTKRPLVFLHSDLRHSLIVRVTPRLSAPQLLGRFIHFTTLCNFRHGQWQMGLMLIT